MADSAHQSKEEIEEKFDPPEVLQNKIDKLYDLILSSSNAIAFVGAGISTAAGIPDFRGPEGVWTLAAQGKNRSRQSVSSIRAIPTATHMSLLALIQRGFLKFIISQNTDGLLRKSGIPPAQLAELHGNTTIEKCVECGKQYVRDFNCRGARDVHDHRTGRKCDDPNCRGELHDSIINFGENLPANELRQGFDWAEKADLCISLGSSLRVTPAANMPEMVALRKKPLVIINLQDTPLDFASPTVLKINARVDEVMKEIMAKFGIEIPQWRLTRRVQISHLINSMDETQPTELLLSVKGVDVDNSPLTFIQEARLCEFASTSTTTTTTTTPSPQLSLPQQPLQQLLSPICPLNAETSSRLKDIARISNSDTIQFRCFFPAQQIPSEFGIILYFFGHYIEPPIIVNYKIPANADSGSQLLNLEYSPYSLSWKGNFM